MHRLDKSSKPVRFNGANDVKFNLTCYAQQDVKSISNSTQQLRVRGLAYAI